MKAGLNSIVLCLLILLWLASQFGTLANSDDPDQERDVWLGSTLFANTNKIKMKKHTRHTLIEKLTRPINKHERVHWALWG